MNSHTMHIDVVLTPAEIDLLPQRDLRGTTAIVFDVLRATSSIVTALASGVAEIYPAGTMEEALELKREMPDALLCGERNGDRPDGFDLGNSPLEYRSLAAARLITTTTNGTVALRACEGADEVLVGALLNMKRLATHLRDASPRNLLLVCAGTFREAALEDVIAAGMLCAAFPGVELSDAARMALAVFDKYQARLADGLHEARNGRALIAKGRGEELLYCAQNSLHDVIGAMKNRVIRRLHAPADKLKSATLDVTH